MDGKGKARADSQLPESIVFKSDGSDCGDEASIDGDRTPPHQVSEDLYVFYMNSICPSINAVQGNVGRSRQSGDYQRH